MRERATHKKSRRARALAYQQAKSDPKFFIDHFCWTHDPRLKSQPDLPAMIPFQLFDFQRDLVDWLQERLEERQSGLIEKSRDMGATWTAAAYAVWLWIFRDDVTIGFGSRKEALVDVRGDPSSIFFKIRTIIEHLPEWLTPAGWERGGDHDNHLRIVNPETGSAIIGEAGDSVGRGGRTLVYFWDEVAYHSGAESVESSLSMNTEIIIYISTPNGVGELFYKKRQSGSIPVLTLHWSLDPRKSEEWRQAFLDEFGPTITAREIDIDYSASVDGVVIPNKWVQAAIDIELDTDIQTVEAGLDVSDGGKDETVMVTRRGPVVENVYSRYSSDGGPTQTGRWAITKALDAQVADLYIDEIGVGSGVVSEIGDKSRDFSHYGVNFGDSPTDRAWSERKLASELFANLKSELYWTLRQRFKRTYEHHTGEKAHDERDLISIPDHADLRADISKPKWESDSQGRIKIESKKKLKKRLGAGASPDYLEALVYAYAGDVVNQKLMIG